MKTYDIILTVTKKIKVEEDVIYLGGLRSETDFIKKHMESVLDAPVAFIESNDVDYDIRMIPSND